MDSLRRVGIRERNVSTRFFWLRIASVLLASAAMPVHAAPDDVTLVSRQSDAAGGAAADNESTQPDISANGRYVVFTSNAQNLGLTPTCPAAATCKQCGDLEEDSTLPAATGIFGPRVHEIWLRDLQTNTLTLVSRADGVNGAPGNGCAVRPAVSSNGRYVVFEASAPNLSPEVGDNWAFHIFLRDTVLNTTTLVDRTSNGGVSNLHSLWGSVSDDGRYVAFNSHSPGELTADELNTTVNTYVRDLQEQTTVLVSRASGANGVTQDADSYGADISGDGRHVAWRTAARNLSPDVDGCFNVFVRHLDSNVTELVSRQSATDGGLGADGSSANGALSYDGRYIAFTSMADNLSRDDYDSNFQNEDHCGNLSEEYGGDNDIFMRDMLKQTTVLASRADGPRGAGAAPISTTDTNQAAAPSYRLGISASGRFVTFLSASDNLSPYDRDDLGTDENFETGLDVFVRDLMANSTRLISRASGPNGAGGDAGTPRRVAAQISEDGRHVAFASYATNFSAIDLDAVSDVFAREMPDPDTISGSTLKLIDNVNPGRRRLIVISRDPHIAVADQVLETGATLRVVGNGIDDTYSLPAANWHSRGQGVSYYDPAANVPLRKAKLRTGFLSISGLGAQLGHSLASNPGPVNVVLTTAQRRYCMEFGGQVAYLTDKTYRAKKAPVPASCP